MMKKLFSLFLMFAMLFSTMPVLAASGTKTYTAPYAGVYQVKSTRKVTVTSELGSTVDLAAGGEGYLYLLQGTNKLSVSNTATTLTFTKLPNNGMDYMNQITIATQPIISGQEDTHALNLNKSLAPGESYTFTYTPSKGLAGLIYPYILFSDGNPGNTIEVSVDKTLILPKGWSKKAVFSRQTREAFFRNTEKDQRRSQQSLQRRIFWG